MIWIQEGGIERKYSGIGIETKVFMSFEGLKVVGFLGKMEARRKNQSFFYEAAISVNVDGHLDFRKEETERNTW